MTHVIWSAPHALSTEKMNNTSHLGEHMAQKNNLHFFLQHKKGSTGYNVRAPALVPGETRKLYFFVKKQYTCTLIPGCVPEKVYLFYMLSKRAFFIKGAKMISYYALYPFPFISPRGPQVGGMFGMWVGIRPDDRKNLCR